MAATVFDFSSGVIVADTDFLGPKATQALQTHDGHTLTVTADSGGLAVVGESAVRDGDTVMAGDVVVVDPFSSGAGTLVLALEDGVRFDLTGLKLMDLVGTASRLKFTTDKGSFTLNLTPDPDGFVLALDDPALRGVAWVQLSNPQGSPLYLQMDDITLDNIAPANTAPAFVGTAPTLDLAQNGAAASLAAWLHVADADSGQTLTWSASAAPGHGTLSVVDATATAGGSDIAPGGTLTYTPTPGFSGVDTFTLQVSDGQATATCTFSVNVVPQAPGRPNLHAASDTGADAGDGLTRADTLSFGGAGATGDSSSTVRVFLDRNGNGVHDAGDAFATGSMNNGAWSVAGLDASGYADGDYLAYAVTTSADGTLSSSTGPGRLVQIDRSAPGVEIGAEQERLKAGESTTLTFSFTEDPGSTFTAADIQVTGGTLGALTGSGAERTATFTPTAGLEATLATITVAAGSYADAAGNAGTSSGSFTLEVDTAPPVNSVESARLSADTGASSTDFVTREAAQTISGELVQALAAGERVEVSLNDGHLWSQASTLGRTWSLAGVMLAGSDTLRVRVADAAGNTGPVAVLAYTMDDTAPVLSQASVTGGTLVLTYADALALDASQVPAAGAFTVQAGGAPVAVTGVALNAQARTVTLTLAAPVAQGQPVTLGYDREGAVGAIRDLAGNLAATLSAQAVDNHTTAPPVPAQPEPPLPEGALLQATPAGGTLHGTAGNDVFLGLQGRDTFVSHGGSDRMEGGGGIDTAVFAGPASAYRLVHEADGSFTVHGPGVEATTLSGIERLRLGDLHLALDADADAAGIAGLYQAAFARRPDAGGLEFHTALLDEGTLSPVQMARNFLTSPEFDALYGGLSDADFVTQLYRNALGRDAEPEGFAYHVQRLAELPDGDDRAALLLGFAQSPEMLARFAGIADAGLLLL